MIVRNKQFAEGRLRVWCTTRHGGVSEAPFDTLNLGDHVGDDPEKVARNRSPYSTSVTYQGKSIG